MQLLMSPMVSDCVYSNQMEELLQLYEGYSMGGLMTLEQFGVVAKVLLIMIYQNTYPDVVSYTIMEKLMTLNAIGTV